MLEQVFIKNIGQLVTPRSDLPMNQLEIVENAGIFIHNGYIKKIGTSTELELGFKSKKYKTSLKIIDAKKGVLLPGFVDSHTHPIYAATREEEFEMRVLGKSYEEIAAAGGGIRNSVRKLRETDLRDLVENGLQRMNRFVANGTTTIEAKSGYGLSLEDELKSLRAIRRLNHLHPIELVPTFLGAHEVPDEFQGNRGEYIRLICEKMIPAVAEEKLAKFCDVFCETGVFSVPESEEILETGKKFGLIPKIHADELHGTGGAELAAKVGAISADHLLHVSDTGIKSMKEKNVVPILLPGTAFFLNVENYAPARKMIDSGLPVALATDSNPGSCMTESMPFILTLASIKMKMTFAEAITSATLNGARAIGMEKKIGSIEIGKQADLVIWNIPNYKYLIYHFGVSHHKIVIKKGEVIYKS